MKQNLNQEELKEFTEILKMNLNFYVPSLVKIVDAKFFPWEKVARQLYNMLSARIEKFGINSTTIVSASLYDYIIHAKKNEKNLISQLKFFEEIFSRINQKLPKNQFPLIRRTVEQFLTSMDYKFRNFLGEFAVLENILTSDFFKLLTVEEKLPNKKSPDFRVYDTLLDKKIHIEVLNIYLDNKEENPSYENIIKFLNHRIDSKINDKLSNISIETTFKIQPVIWGSWNHLEPFIDFFEDNILDNPNALEPFSYAIFTEENGNIHHVFKYISNLKKFHL